MKEYALYSGVTSGLIVVLGCFPTEEDACCYAEEIAEDRGWDITNDYVAERYH